MTTFESGKLNTKINIRNQCSKKQCSTCQGRHLTSQGGGLAHKTNLSPPLIIEVHLPSPLPVCVCMCVCVCIFVSYYSVYNAVYRIRRV